jgi:hypothetical protein
MKAKHKNTGRWEGVKPRLSHFQVYLAAKKCGPGRGGGAASKRNAAKPEDAATHATNPCTPAPWPWAAAQAPGPGRREESNALLS